MKSSHLQFSELSEKQIVYHCSTKYIAMASNPKKPHLQLETPENTEESSSSFASEESGENEGSRSNRRNGTADSNRVMNGNDSDSDSDDNDDEELGQHQLSPAEREIQVDFEARSPQECDFHGIVNLLRQMMRSNAGNNSSSVNVSDLANHLIAQRNVGSVITQSHDDMDDDDSDDEQENNAGGANNASSMNGHSNDMLEPNNEVRLTIEIESKTIGFRLHDQFSNL